ncbi:MAG: hypothetical protein ACK41T_09675 [Pseudobdellovibrio sp.]
MDNINLPSVLFLIWDIKRAIEKSVSVREGVKMYLSRQKTDKFAENFTDWWTSSKDNEFDDDIYIDKFNAQQRVILSLIRASQKGLPILEQIRSIEVDFIDICESDIQEHTAKLPLIMQIPLIFLIFPAICILLLVPTLSQLSF